MPEVYGLQRYEFRDFSLLEMVMNQNDEWNNRAIVFPPLQQSVLRATDSFTGVIKVVPGSLLISFSGYSEREAGYMLSIYDKSANYYMFQGEYDWWRNQVGVMDGQGNGQRFFTEPVLVQGNGQLQITVTNLDKLNNNRCQVVLQFAERVRDINDVIRAGD